MKKSKLLTSLCMLVLTIACLTFGVYSAVKTSFTASGTITFNNYGIDADITIDIYGVENGTTIQSTDENYGTVTGLKKRTVLASTGSTASARSAYQANVITTIPALSLGELKFDELNTTVAEEWRSKIVLVISFTNYSKFDAQLSITQEAAATTNLTATYGSKVKATKSTDGTTGVVSTSSLTITLTPTDTTAAVSGTFDTQITLQPAQMPVKGDLITMNLGSTEVMVGMENQYRVLNINGNIAEVVAMYEAKESQPYWGTNQTTTDANNNIVTKYGGSDLDTYLNTNWYGTLSDAAKQAIVENNIIQYSYASASSAYNESTHASWEDYSSKAIVYQDTAKTIITLTRKVYALDIEDIEAYFGGTVGVDCKTAGEFNAAGLLKMFWDTDSQPIDFVYPWLRSACADNSAAAWAVNNDGGGMYYGDVTNTISAARPAFKIDLSKIDWA